MVPGYINFNININCVCGMVLVHSTAQYQVLVLEKVLNRYPGTSQIVYCTTVVQQKVGFSSVGCRRCRHSRDTHNLSTYPKNFYMCTGSQGAITSRNYSLVVPNLAKNAKPVAKPGKSKYPQKSKLSNFLKKQLRFCYTSNTVCRQYTVQYKKYI